MGSEIKPPGRALNETHAAMLEAWAECPAAGGCDIFNRGFLAGVEYAVSRIWEGGKWLKNAEN